MREVNSQKSEYKMFYEKNRKWLVPTIVVAIIIGMFICRTGFPKSVTTAH